MSSLSPMERMRAVMSGGVTSRDSDRVEGRPDEVSQRILEFLLQHGIVAKSTNARTPER